MFTGVRWFSATDKQNGKTYFYEENGNESCWTLPNVSQSIQDPPQTFEQSDSSVAFKTSLQGGAGDEFRADNDVQVRKRIATAGAVLLRKDLANQNNGNDKGSNKLDGYQ